MSRIGKRAVDIPAGVSVTVSDENLVSVKGAKGELSQQIDPILTVTIEGNILTVKRPDDSKPSRSKHGLYRTLIANMIDGVSNGFEKSVLIVGTGYRAIHKGNKMTITVGFSHPVEVIAPDGIEFVVENYTGVVEYAERSKIGNPTKITVKGINKQVVGQVAADIRAIRPPEPYLGKGIRYFDEVIRRKEGKAAG